MGTAMSRRPQNMAGLLQQLTDRVRRLESARSVNLGQWVLQETSSGQVVLRHPDSGRVVELTEAVGELTTIQEDEEIDNG